MRQEHEMTPGVLISGDDMSAGDYKARCAVLEAELADHERLQAETERLQAASAADKARIVELEAVLERVAVWVEKLPVPTNGACAQLARIDAALAQHLEDNN